MELHSVELKTISPKVFEVFGSNYALLTAGDREKCNTMTIGWCGLGRIWNQPACTVYVRPERYTYGFMERHDYFTVSILSTEKKNIMKLCGTKSGREVDKIRECGLTLRYGEGDAPYFAEAEWALVCKKRYAQDMKPEFCRDERIGAFYRGEGWHRMYIGEVVEAYQK